MKLSINRLEDILLAQGKINKEQHARIRKHIMENRISSAVAINDLKIMDYNGIYRVVAEALGVEYVPIGDRYGSLDEKVIALLPERTCKAFCVLPWKIEGNVLKLLIENPQDSVALKEVRDFTGMKVIPVMAIGKQLKNIIEHYFNQKHEKEKMLSLTKQTVESVATSITPETLTDGTGPIVEFINMLLERAALTKASDIHIKPNEKDIRIRMRIDGELREVARVEHIAPSCSPFLTSTASRALRM